MAKARAKKGGLFGSLFYILMSVMAMNFLVLCIVLIGLYAAGFYNKQDIDDIMLVLVGNRKYALTKDQIKEYTKLVEQRKASDAAMDSSEGSLDTRKKSAAALDDMIKQLQEKNRALRELRTLQQQRLEDLRADIESLKKDYIKEREDLKTLKTERTKAEQSERYTKTLKTLREMDPELIGQLFLGNMQRADGAEENARIIRKYLTPTITSEVMGTIPVKDMRQIVPLIENKYAGMSPKVIASRWTTPGTEDYKTPEQMALYMRNMTVSQAFTIFTLLDAKTRAELVRLLKAPLGNDGQ